MSQNNFTERASNCDAIQDLIPEYAFGLTNAEEARLVEANLADCPDAEAQLADYRLLQDEMRAGVPQMMPPPQLEERLLAATTAPDLIPQPRRRAISLAWLAAAAAIIALVITNLYWFSRVDDLSRRRDELTAQLGAPGSAFVLTSTKDLRWTRLPPTQEDGEASAFLMWNGDSATGLLYARGFPELEPDKTYQLWLTRGEERISAGTFRVDEAGIGALLFHLDEPIDEYTRAGITDEPMNGSRQPTGTAVVRGEL